MQKRYTFQYVVRVHKILFDIFNFNKLLLKYKLKSISTTDACADVLCYQGFSFIKSENILQYKLS